MRRALRRVVALGLIFGGTALARAEEVSSVVELFTSQGCSSCPPADALVARMAREAHVLAVSFPVDYWDYMGWKDTLASPAFSARQSAYARARGDAQIYTPQIVVDGLQHVVGSDGDEINGAIGRLGRQPGVLAVPIALHEAEGRIDVSLGAATGNAPRAATLWLLHVAKAATVTIARGENAGHTVTYTNVVRSMSRIGEWSGAAASYQVPLIETKAAGADAYAIVLQAGSMARPGAILAAAKSEGM